MLLSTINIYPLFNTDYKNFWIDNSEFLKCFLSIKFENSEEKKITYFSLPRDTLLMFFCIYI